MAIRDRVRRALNKSDSSDMLSQTESNGTASTANTSQSSEGGRSSKKSSSKLSGLFGSRSKDKVKDGKRRAHPSEKPLTTQNLLHQEMLSHFTMTFGASDPNQIESASFMGVSPCCTRPSSPRTSLNLDSSRDDLSSYASVME